MKGLSFRFLGGGRRSYDPPNNISSYLQYAVNRVSKGAMKSLLVFLYDYYYSAFLLSFVIMLVHLSQMKSTLLFLHARARVLP